MSPSSEFLIEAIADSIQEVQKTAKFLPPEIQAFLTEWKSILHRVLVHEDQLKAIKNPTMTTAVEAEEEVTSRLT